MRARSKAEERLIRVITKRGGKGFQILRSAETGLKCYHRATAEPTNPDPQPTTEDA